MKNLYQERIIAVNHWNDKLFSFQTTRNPGLRFENGQFVMVGLKINGKLVMRAYSIASPNYEEHLEFFSIKLDNGLLTSQLKKIKVGDEIMISKKPTGTIVVHDVLPGEKLYMLATGTGLAPFLSLIRDPEVYDKFSKVILVHCVRNINDLAYKDYIENDLINDEFLGEYIKNQLIYYPTVTREDFNNKGRITDLIRSGILFDRLGFEKISPQSDRAMICGSPEMLRETSRLLDEYGFEISEKIGYPGDYVIERAFVS